MTREYPASEQEWIQPAGVRARELARRAAPVVAIVVAAWLLGRWLRRRRT